MQIMHYGLWKSLAAVQRYLEHFDGIYISRLIRVVVFFWLDDASHAPHTHIIGLQFSWSTTCSTSATTVCEPDHRPK
jgi:hypothetical protein